MNTINLSSPENWSLKDFKYRGQQSDELTESNVRQLWNMVYTEHKLSNELVKTERENSTIGKIGETFPKIVTPTTMSFLMAKVAEMQTQTTNLCFTLTTAIIVLSTVTVGACLLVQESTKYFGEQLEKKINQITDKIKKIKHFKIAIPNWRNNAADKVREGTTSIEKV
jgi:hypothetical protein